MLQAVLITVFVYSFILTVALIYKDNSSYFDVDTIDAVMAGPCSWVLILILAVIIRPIYKTLHKNKHKGHKEKTYTIKQIQKTTQKFIKLYKKRHGDKNEWVQPPDVCIEYDDCTIRPYQMKLRSPLFERIENKFHYMCYHFPKEVFAEISKIGHPITESKDWEEFKKDYPYASKTLEEKGVVEI